MKYEALVLDLDGTLMTSKNTITETTQDLLIKIQELGIKVILASGRPTHGLKQASKQLKLKEYGGYILSYNGGCIIDVKNNQLLVDSFLDKEMMDTLYDASRNLNTHLLAYTDDYIITEDDDEYIQIESQLNQMPIVRVPNFKEEIKDKSVKCLMTGDPKHLIQVEQKLKQRFENQLSISRSQPFFLELMSLGINKGNRLNLLLEKLNIHPDNVIACGDGYNDIALIEAVGLGVAMENGCDLIKEKAHIIAPSNDNEGISHIIKKYLILQES